MTSFLRSIFSYLFMLLCGIVLFHILWEFFSFVLAFQALPGPLEVYADAPKALRSGLLGHVWASCQRALWGIVLATVFAFAIGIPMGRINAINRLCEPLLYFSYPLPKLALLPVVMVLLGIGEASKITIIVLILVFQLIIAIRDAIRAIPAESYAVLRTLRASAFESLVHVTLPAILPAIFSSLRMATGVALSALFVIETYGTTKGLGFYITDCWMRLDYLQMYFGLITLAALGFALFIACDAGERVFCRWSRIR